MATTTYTELLKHPSWQKKRLETLEASGWECVQCGAKDKTLHVHHKKYIKGRKPWEYDSSELEVLCEGCHQSEHDHRAAFDRLIATAHEEGVFVQIVQLVAGYMDGCLWLDESHEKDIEFLRSAYYDAGIMASMSDGCPWGRLVQAAPLLMPCTNPVQDQAISRWREGAESE